MCYLVIVDHKDMAVHLTRSDREVLNFQCSGWDWWYVVEWQWKSMGMLGVSVRKVKALIVKIETVTLMKADKILHALCIKCMKLIVKYIFIWAVALFLGVFRDLDKYIFPC